MLFYVSWSPASGEATYTRFFYHRSERDTYAAGVAYIAASVHTWESEYQPEAEKE